MVKHTQTICWQIADEFFEGVSPFCGVVTKSVKITKEENNNFILTSRYEEHSVSVFSNTYFHNTGSSDKLETYLCSHVKY